MDRQQGRSSDGGIRKLTSKGPDNSSATNCEQFPQKHTIQVTSLDEDRKTRRMVERLSQRLVAYDATIVLTVLMQLEAGVSRLRCEPKMIKTLIVILVNKNWHTRGELLSGALTNNIPLVSPKSFDPTFVKTSFPKLCIKGHSYESIRC